MGILQKLEEPHQGLEAKSFSQREKIGAESPAPVGGCPKYQDFRWMIIIFKRPKPTYSFDDKIWAISCIGI